MAVQKRTTLSARRPKETLDDVRTGTLTQIVRAVLWHSERVEKRYKTNITSRVVARLLPEYENLMPLSSRDSRSWSEQDAVAVGRFMKHLKKHYPISDAMGFHISNYVATRFVAQSPAPSRKIPRRQRAAA